MQEKIGHVAKHNSKMQEGIPVGGGGRGNITLIPSLPKTSGQQQGSEIPSLMKLNFSSIGTKPSAGAFTHPMMNLDGGGAVHTNLSWDEVSQ